MCGRFWPRLGMWLSKADFGTGRVARFGTHWQRLRGLLRQVLAVFVWLDLAGCGSLCVCVCVCVARCESFGPWVCGLLWQVSAMFVERY